MIPPSLGMGWLFAGLLDKLCLLEAHVGRVFLTDLKGRFSGCYSETGQLGAVGTE